MAHRYPCRLMATTLIWMNWIVGARVQTSQQVGVVVGVGEAERGVLWEVRTEEGEEVED